MSKAKVLLHPDAQGGGGVRITAYDRALVGKQAKLTIGVKAHVHDSRAIHKTRTVFEQALTISTAQTDITLPAGTLNGIYSYKGSKVDLRPELRLVIDDGILFDSTIDQEHEIPLGDRPRVGHDTGQMMDPKDAYNFFANLSAIPYSNRMITLALTLIGGVIVIGNALLGVHDEFVTEAQTLFYDHSGSDGSESPIMKALAGSGAMGAGIWAAIQMQLRKYISFTLKPHTAPQRGQPMAARNLIDAVARVDLEDITIRVVACNRESGQYKRSSGSKERTVNFKTATRAVKLYERYIALVPAKVPLAMYLEGDIDFEAMFANLYPPLEVGSTHGVSVAWEVQLLHPKFVDHEIEGATAGLRYRDFLDG